MNNNELYHYGVPGMRWGHRKAQPEAYQRLGRSRTSYKTAKKQASAQYKQAKKDYRNDPEVKAIRKQKAKRALKVGAAVAGTALAAYGAYKLNKFVKDKNCQIASKKGLEYARKRFESETKFMVDSYSGGMRKVSVDSGRISRDFANRASQDNFRTAAKNVIDYKRKNGNLRTGTVDFNSSFGKFETVLDDRRRRR